MTELVHELIFASARRTPDGEALVFQADRITYAALAKSVMDAANALLALGLARGARVAVYLDKCPEAVFAMFGATAAGGVMVPINPLLKADQVVHILADCNVAILVTSPERLAVILSVLGHCGDLKTVLVTGSGIGSAAPIGDAIAVINWSAACVGAKPGFAHRAIDADMAAILYTSGSTGLPKGVVISHRNLVTGAASVVQYLGNTANDRILSLLPLSFDYGLSQLTTAFHSGAAVVLLNYLLPRDVLNVVLAERITGLAAVPPLWLQIAELAWPAGCSLRYLTNSGGAMPRATLERLRARLPGAAVYLMYGLTEAFRSTYLPPDEVDRRPDSIGRAIPNVEVLVLRPDGTCCEPGEPGELVHRGALVAMGYWNDPVKTAERFRLCPARPAGLPLAEIAVWSGDTVRVDAEGYLYFIGRNDEMIKSSGYRISPTEIEEVLYAQQAVAEAAAFGMPHAALGQAIVVIVTARGGERLDVAALLLACRPHLPTYMVPHQIVLRQGSLPRNANGKIDRNRLRLELQQVSAQAAT